jgi:hypothetical protein
MGKFRIIKKTNMRLIANKLRWLAKTHSVHVLYFLFLIPRPIYVQSKLSYSHLPVFKT